MAINLSPEPRPLSSAAELKRLSHRYFKTAFLVALIFHLLMAVIVLLTGVGEQPARTYQIRLLPYNIPPSQARASSQIEIVDVPEEARRRERPPAPTPFVADKNAIARDRADKRTLPKGLPYSEGDSELRDTGPSGEPWTRSGGLPDFRETPKIPQWTREVLVRPEYRQTSPTPRLSEHDESLAQVVPKDDLDERRKERKEEDLAPRRSRLFGWDRKTLARSQFRNKVSVAPEVGDFSLSTLEWEYAPYLYALRERVRQHWFPPPAFYMGLVSGRVVLRFKIMRDGSVRDLEALTRRDDRAYESLVASSLNAVRGSDPFTPLPSDFPDPFLEITATFYYRILGEESGE